MTLLHLVCIRYFLIVLLEMVDYNFATRESEIDLNQSLPPPPEPLSTLNNITDLNQQPPLDTKFTLKKITDMFLEQYKGKKPDENPWGDLENEFKIRQWSNLCFQSWHLRDNETFSHYACTAKPLPYKKNAYFGIVIPGEKNVYADTLKCMCPQRHSNVKILVNDNNHIFFLVRKTNEEYFVFIAKKKRVLILHGYVTDLHAPFTTILSSNNRHYFTTEAEEHYNEFLKLHYDSL